MASSRALGGGCRTLMAAAKAGTASASAKAPRSKAGIKRGVVLYRTKKKALPVSPELGSFLGTPEASRTDAVQKVWDHVKLHNLMTTTKISCDEKLKTIFFGKDSVPIPEIVELLSGHFIISSTHEMQVTTLFPFGPSSIFREWEGL